MAPTTIEDPTYSKIFNTFGICTKYCRHGTVQTPLVLCFGQDFKFYSPLSVRFWKKASPFWMKYDYANNTGYNKYSTIKTNIYILIELLPLCTI